MRVQAQDADEENKHKREIEEQIQKVTMALYTQRAGESEEETLQRAMRDPEIAVRDGSLLCFDVAETRGTGDHERPRYAADSAASAAGAGCVAGPHEESYNPEQDTEADCSRNNQDTVKVERENVQ